MSDQKMQFADPEWRPPLQGGSIREQESYNPVDINDPSRQQTDGQTTARNEDEETGDTDYTRGYRAEQPGNQSAQAELLQQRPRPNRSPWFWVILVAIVIAILSFTPFGEDSIISIIAFWRVLMLSIIAAASITVLISIAIRLSRK